MKKIFILLLISIFTFGIISCDLEDSIQGPQNKWCEKDIEVSGVELTCYLLFTETGYTHEDLNSEKFIKESGNYIYDYSNMDFVNYYDDCKFIDNAVKTFWWDIIFNNINEMNVPNKLYTRYKP